MLQQECNFFSSHCISTGKGGNPHYAAPLSFIVAVLPSLTPVLQSREVSTEHRMDVKALALICAEVQTLHRFNKADFYLLM